MQAGIPYTVATGEKLVNETFGPNNIQIGDAVLLESPKAFHYLKIS